MKIKAAIGLALCALILVGCGGSNETETVKVVHVGDRVVTIPMNTPKGAFAVTRALMAQTAYMPWYQRCVLSQAERQLTPAEAEALVHLPPREREARGLRLFQEAAPRCEDSTRLLVDPHAAPGKIAPIRAQTATSLATALRTEGASEAEQQCVAREVARLNDTEMIDFANGSRRAQDAALEALIRACV